MRKSQVTNAVILLLVLAIGIIGSVVVYKKRGIPFVAQKEQWTIGIYTGRSPFDFTVFQGFRNPVLRGEDVTDIPAKFVADPFLVEEDSKWLLFFEAYNLNSNQGDLALATSTDGRKWEYDRVVLDEPFHLSYPYVFKWEGDYYLVPETYESESIRLYKAKEFPTDWEYIQTLIEGMALVDPSIAHYQDRWWMFASDATNKNDTLRLFYADELAGPWQEHPQSPIVEGDANIARPAGRALVYEDRLYRYTQDSDPTYGNQIWAFEVTDISPTVYAERLVSEEPILKADGRGWNEQSMHNIDPVQAGENKWITAVDGFGDYLIFGLDY